MKGMVSLMFMVVSLFMTTSPLKFSFLLMILSLWVAAMSLMNNSNIFPASGLIISFSTGMMVLFCYCSSMINYEKKNLLKIRNLMLILLSIPVLTTENMSEMTNMSSSPMKFQLQFMTVAIAMVVVSMLGINKSMFNPSKSAMSSY